MSLARAAYNAIAMVHSWWVCRGSHDMHPTVAFIPDPNGPDIYVDPLGLFKPLRGHRKPYSHCWRCGLRDDGTGYNE